MRAEARCFVSGTREAGRAGADVEDKRTSDTLPLAPRTRPGAGTPPLGRPGFPDTLRETWHGRCRDLQEASGQLRQMDSILFPNKESVNYSVVSSSQDSKRV